MVFEQSSALQSCANADVQVVSFLECLSASLFAASVKHSKDIVCDSDSLSSFNSIIHRYHIGFDSHLPVSLIIPGLICIRGRPCTHITRNCVEAQSQYRSIQSISIETLVTSLEK